MASDVAGAPTETGATPGSGEAPRSWSLWSRLLDRGLVWAFLELFVLTGFVVAQPLLDVTGKAPDFFVFRRADRRDIVLLVIAITVLPALALWAVELVANLVAPRLRRAAHLLIVTALLVLLAVEVGKKLLPLRGAALAAVAVVVGLAAGLLYLKQRWVRTWLRYLTPAPLVFALLFATTSPSAKLVLPSGGVDAGKAPVASSVKRPPLVMIFFDEFPLQSLLNSKGQIDRRLYPNLAKFADQSNWYRNATGAGGFTPFAMPAMLTGQYPMKVKAPIAEEYPDNMFTLFGRYYNLKSSELITQLCPVARCGQAGGGAGGGFRAVLKDSAQVWADIASPNDTNMDTASFVDNQTVADANAGGGNGGAGAGQVGNGNDAKTDLKPSFLFNQIGQSNQPNRWSQFLDSIKGTDPQPTMYFLHLLLPHAPWYYLPDGIQYPYKTFGLSIKEDQWGPGIVETDHERHLLQLAYTDKLIGQLVQRLKDQGLYDESLVVLTADHGRGFSVGDKTRGLGERNAPSLMWVPLFIKAPNQTKGRVDDRNWEHVDLLPTLADMVKIQVPWRTDGFSQTGPSRRDRKDKYWYGIPGRREVRDIAGNFPAVLRGVTDTLVKGSQEGYKGLYRYGPNGDWVYRAPKEVGSVTGGGPALTAKITKWDQFETIEPTSGKVPSLVYGEMTSGTPPRDAELAVAINGQIGGVTKFFFDTPGGQASKFAAVVPDFLFKPGPGRSQVQLYLVERPRGGKPTFRPVALSG